MILAQVLDEILLFQFAMLLLATFQYNLLFCIACLTQSKKSVNCSLQRNQESEKLEATAFVPITLMIKREIEKVHL